MEYRTLGRTGLRVSALGFGCGSIGGLMVRGQEDEQRRTFERALEAGITYFDTAPSYGDGRSEETLGRAGRRGPDPIVELEQVDRIAAETSQAGLERASDRPRRVLDLLRAQVDLRADVDLGP